MRASHVSKWNYLPKLKKKGRRKVLCTDACVVANLLQFVRTGYENNCLVSGSRCQDE